MKTGYDKDKRTPGGHENSFFVFFFQKIIKNTIPKVVCDKNLSFRKDSK